MKQTWSHGHKSRKIFKLRRKIKKNTLKTPGQKQQHSDPDYWLQKTRKIDFFRNHGPKVIYRSRLLRTETTDTIQEGGTNYWGNLEKDLKPRTEMKKKGPTQARKLLKNKRTDLDPPIWNKTKVQISRKTEEMIWNHGQKGKGPSKMKWRVQRTDKTE